MAPKMEPKGHPETSLGITFDEYYQRTSEPAQQRTSEPAQAL